MIRRPEAECSRSEPLRVMFIITSMPIGGAETLTCPTLIRQVWTVRAIRARIMLPQATRASGSTVK